MRFAKLLNEFVSQEELFPISFAKLLNEFVSKKELFPISAESIFSNLLCIFPIVPLGSLFCQTGFFFAITGMSGCRFHMGAGKI